MVKVLLELDFDETSYRGDPEMQKDALKENIINKIKFDNLFVKDLKIVRFPIHES